MPGSLNEKIHVGQNKGFYFTDFFFNFQLAKNLKKLQFLVQHEKNFVFDVPELPGN